MSEIYTALAAVMADCDHVAKRDRNEHQRFMFRGIDAVLNAVGPVLRKHGVIVAPNVEQVHYETVQTSTGKPATACRVLVTYSFYAADGSSIDTRVAGEAWDSGDKACPKAMSVAFRTALLQALALPTDEPDPDSQSYERGNTAATEPPPPMRRMGRNVQPPVAPPVESPLLNTGSRLAKAMFAALGEAGIDDRDERLAYVAGVIGRDVGSSSEMTDAEASQVVAALQREKAGAPA